jgi:hypothetical protein
MRANGQVKVQVLMVSLCLAQRRRSLLHAIDGIVNQEGVRATAVVVVNGERFDPRLFEELERRRGVRVVYQKEASIFLARRRARECVETPYFAMLDDDDELLPGALRARLQPLLDDATVDVVVSNGYLADEGEESLILADVAGIGQDPLGRLMEANWLPTAAGLYRSSAVTPDYFDVTLRSIDMTYLAFRLALDKRLVFLGQPTFRKRYSADSISSTDAWMLPAADTLRKMLTFPMPASVRRKLRRKYGAALHAASDHFLRHGSPGKAWSCHLRSLMQPSGLARYGLYTRRLLIPAVWRRRP